MTTASDLAARRAATMETLRRELSLPAISPLLAHILGAYHRHGLSLATFKQVFANLGCSAGLWARVCDYYAALGRAHAQLQRRLRGWK